MPNERWLPLNYALPDGSSVRNLYVGGGNWQLYTTTGSGQVLAVSAELHQAWLDRDWIEPGIFAETDAGCLIWCARDGSMISSMEFGPYPMKQEQAETFVQTLRRSRESMGRISFSDALYIAQFSVLMPTFSGARPLSDALVLGRWFTGGIEVPVTDIVRVRRYAPWLSAGMLDRILGLMDFSADVGSAGVLDAPPDAQPTAALAPILPSGGRAMGAFTLAGRPELERFFREELIDIIDREAEYRRMGIEFPGPVLLYGPPGCGKTYAIEQLTKYLGWPVYNITSGSVGSKYIHETSRKVSEIFDQAIANAPAVIVIDELEAFLSSREDARASGEIHMEEVAEFLRRIPDATKHRVLLFGMTNMIDAIDKAILRRGRFDHVLEVGMPSEEEILALLQSLLAPLPTEGELDLEACARKLSGSPISDVAFAVRKAGQLAVRGGSAAIDAGILARACEQATGNRRPVRRIGFQSTDA